MLQLNNIEYKTRNGFYLEPISISLTKSDVFYIVGQNGAGKSTLFSIIAGLIKPKKGTLSINGLTDPWEYRKHLSISFDECNYNPSLTGATNLKSTCLRRNVADDAYKQYLEGFELDRHIKNNLSTYSFGTKKKIGIIAGLMVDADYYIFDEPTSGLDLKASHYFYQEVDKLIARGKTILLSTHLPCGYEPTPTHLYLLNNGTHTIATSPPADQLNNWLSNSLKTHYAIT